MADGPVPINLKVLSPSTDVKGDIYIPDIPASTTVQELRLRLQDQIEGRPATERMRLIYRGRVIAKETDRLVDVFGLENIRDSKDQTLHLVLRELHPTSTSSSPAPRTSAVSPNPFRPSTNPPQPPGGSQQTNNPFRAAPPQPRPNSQPQIPHTHPHTHPHHHHHAHHHHHPQQPHNPFGVPLPPLMFQQQLAQAMAQNNAQNGAQQSQQSAGGTPNPPNGVQAPRTGTPPVLGQGPLNFPPNTTRTVRHEAIGPNGERVTVTWNNTNITIPANHNQQPILPRPFPHPPGFPVNARQSPGPSVDAVDQILARARIGLQTARQEMENVRVLLQGPSGEPTTLTPPLWRIDRIRNHIHNLTQGLDQVQRGLTALTGDPSMVNNRDVVLLQQSTNELRGHTEDLNAMLDRMRAGGAPTQEPGAQDTSTASLLSTSSGARLQSTFPLGTPQGANVINSSFTPSAPELFVLSSPQGPVGILFDQRGTYSTAPMVSTLPFQAFTQHFSNNRQALAGIGQHIGQNTNQLHHRLGANQAAQQNNQPAIPPQGLPDPPMAQNANQNQPADQGPAQNAAGGENDRLAVWAGHAWFIFKIVCFIYIFAGGGGWYRPAMMALVGALVYLAQIGIFEAQFNRIRQHFEALLPMPDRVGQQPNLQGPNQNVDGQPQGQGPGTQRAEPDRNLTPEQAARRLMQQRGNHPFGWIRESTRSVERACAIFVASLWPGIGEGMVRAQEERERAERQAEEERQRQEEERQQQEDQQAEEQNSTLNKEKTEVKAEEDSVTAKESKGKEKVEVAEESSSTS